jgi:rhodanese-related sulfurtransferase
MSPFLKKIFGTAPAVDFSTLVKNGAVIIDVRSKVEYTGGHVKGSINIPLDTLANHLTRFKKNQVIITCCASGMRSSSAKSLLQANGFEEVHNGGGWSSLQQKLS